MFRVCHAILTVHCSRVVTCCERANLLAFLYAMFSCVFVTFGLCVYLIVSIPDLCLLPHLVKSAYQKLICLFLNQNICYGYSKEPSQCEGSFDHPKHMLKLMGMKLFTILVSKNLRGISETMISL